MHNSKKRLVSAVLAMAIAFSSVGVTAYAEGLSEGESVEVSVNGGVLVNEVNFPDEMFRNYVSASFDANGDGSLSEEEINSVTEINVMGDTNREGIKSLKGVEYFTALEYLNCSYNQITSLDVSKNTALTNLVCTHNIIAELDLSKNTALTGLNCDENKLTSLDLSKNTALTGLSCNGNFQLTSLDLKNNTALEYLNCGYCYISSLDLTNNPKLSHLECQNNRLKSIKFGGSTALEYLNCEYNQLTSLDLSNNTAFMQMWASFNSYVLSTECLDELTQYGFDPKRASGWEGAEYDEETNSLVDIYLDEVTYEYAFSDDPNNTIIITLVTSEIDIPQVCEINMVNFPDGNFYSYVSYNLDLNQNGSLSAGEIKQVKEIEIIASTSTRKVWNLKGIEYFTELTSLKCQDHYLESLDLSKNTALEYLDCSNNLLTSIDVSKNTALEYLECDFNRLTSLDISGCTKLDRLYCPFNQLTSLDVSKNTALTFLDCWQNRLESLDVSKNTALTYLNCLQNRIESLDVSKNTALIDLICSENLLTSLDVGKNTVLEYLACGSNQLTGLDVSKNTALTVLSCDYNQLTSLDVSKNTALWSLNCSENLLTSLDLSNNTELISLCSVNNLIEEYDLSNNNSLEYFFVFPKEYVLSSTSLDELARFGFEPEMTGNWNGAEYDSETNSLKRITKKKVTVEYYISDDPYILTLLPPAEAIEPVCEISETNFPDKAFRNYISLNIDSDGDGRLYDEEIQSAVKFDVSNKSVSNLKGIEYFTALEELNCSGNNLASLDLSKNTALTHLGCAGNSLADLDVSANTALESLDCSGNSLADLDVSENTALAKLYCYNNRLTSLDVSANTQLTELYCFGNLISSVDLSGNTKLESFFTMPINYVLASNSLGELAQFGFEPARASNWTGAQYDSATNSLKNISSGDVSFEYSIRENVSEIIEITVPVPPSKPDIVRAKAGDKQVTLSWTAASGAASYTIYKYENGKYTKINSTASTTYTVKGLTNGTTYKFLVRAFNVAGGSAFSTADLVSATPKAAVVSVPSKPANVKATAGDKQVTLTWTAATGATSYTIYKYEGGKYTKINSTTKTTYTVTGLTNGTTYKFLVRAFNSAGGNSFTTADLVSATPKAAATAPAKPTVSANVQDKVVTFSWNAVSGATYYKLYNYSGGKYGLIDTTTSTSYRLRYLKNGTTYKILVRAFNDKGGSAFTTADLITVTPKAANAVPSKATVTATVSGGNVNLTWAHVPTAFSYTIYKFENGTYTKFGATCDNYFTVKGLTAGKTYSILVRAFNSKGGHKVTSGDRVAVTL